MNIGAGNPVRRRFATVGRQALIVARELVHELRSLNQVGDLPRSGNRRDAVRRVKHYLEQRYHGAGKRCC